MLKKHKIFFSCLLLFTFYTINKQIAHSQTEFTRPFQDTQVVSSFIYNLLNFIKWEKQYKHYVICIVDDSEVTVLLKQINSDPSYTHELNIKEGTAADNYQGCHIVYIGNLVSKKNISLLLNKIDKKNVLIVSDIKNFSRQGGTIEFVFNESSIAIRGNKNIISQATFTISAELLDIMELVENNYK